MGPIVLDSAMTDTTAIEAATFRRLLDHRHPIDPYAHMRAFEAARARHG